MNRERVSPGFFSFLVAAVLLAGTVLIDELPVLAQQAPVKKPPVRPKARAGQAAPAEPAEQPKMKGIWEPRPYSEDINFTDVFFVTPEVGWVAGEKGTLLKTSDAGETWTVQQGGDPTAEADPVKDLRFLDETHGWAVLAGHKLLRTSDGETWEEFGRLGAEGVGADDYRSYVDYEFLSENVAVQIVRNVYKATKILRTEDAGQTWQEVLPTCQAKMQMAGMTKNVTCALGALHFVSPEVGYAIGFESSGVGWRTEPLALFVLKTQDGGLSWEIVAVIPALAAPGEPYSAQGTFFIDENVGYLALGRSGKILATTDGGQTWRGLIGTPGESIKFADPEVGWSFIVGGGNKAGMLTYTLDGGKRWTSTRIAFPANVNAFNLPRRDHAIVVGDHGMIYRYRVAPATEMVANAVAGPAMPVLDSPLDENVEELASEVQGLESSVTEAAEAAGVQAPAEPAEAAPEEGEGEEGEEESTEITGWAKDCCGPKLQKLQTILEAVSSQVPQFTGKYRNLNLVFSGLQVTGQMFGQAQSLKDTFRGIRRNKDPQAVMSAVGQLTSLVQSFRQTTRQAFQKPPEE